MDDLIEEEQTIALELHTTYPGHEINIHVEKNTVLERKHSQPSVPSDSHFNTHNSVAEHIYNDSEDDIAAEMGMWDDWN